MRTLEDRRRFRKNKMKQRENVLKYGGSQCGTLYEKHINKIEEKGVGFMSKHGTLLHYACGTNNSKGKVRDRSSYNGTNHWNHNDRKQMDSMDNQMNDYFTKEEMII